MLSKNAAEPLTYRGLTEPKKIPKFLLPLERTQPQSCFPYLRDQDASAAVCGPDPTGLSELSPVSSPWPVPFRRGPRTHWFGLASQLLRALRGCLGHPGSYPAGMRQGGRSANTWWKLPSQKAPSMAWLQEIQGRKGLGLRGPPCSHLQSISGAGGVGVLEGAREEMRINTSELEGRGGGLRLQPLGSP